MDARNYQPSLLWALVQNWYINQLETPPLGGSYHPHELTVYVYRTDTTGAYRLSGPKLYWQDTPISGDHFCNIAQNNMADHAEELGEVIIYDSRLRKTTVIGYSFPEAWKTISAQ